MFCIRIAGVVIGVDNRYPYVRQMCRGYRVFWRRPAFVVRVSEPEILAEQGGSPQYSPGYCESLCVYRKISQELLRYDAFVMHSAVVAVDGSAYAFAARSGTGKTTHIRLWQKLLGRRMEIVNGDKPILRFRGDTLYACGTPWCGKEKLQRNVMRPLKAMCFLERGKENTIRPLSAEEVSDRIFHQLLLPENEADADRFFSLVEKMMDNVEFYLLHCNMEPEAAQVSYSAMSGQK